MKLLNFLYVRAKTSSTFCILFSRNMVEILPDWSSGSPIKARACIYTMSLKFSDLVCEARMDCGLSGVSGLGRSRESGLLSIGANFSACVMLDIFIIDHGDLCCKNLKMCL